jgi:chemotaxis methyl-accepting protein methylase
MVGDNGLQIFGTDLDPAAIRFARNARYPKQALERLPPALRRHFFVEGDGAARVVDRLRRSALFAWHDLLRDAPLSRMDIVCCRRTLARLDDDLRSSEGGRLIGAKRMSRPRSRSLPAASRAARQLVDW